MKRKKLSIAKKGFCIGAIHGCYIAAESCYHQDTGAFPVTLYKVTSSGIKKIKRLTNYGCGYDVKFIGTKLYYASYSNNDLSESDKIILYRCSQDGSDREKLGTFQDARIAFGDDAGVTSKYCYIWTHGYKYKYTYSTKKLVKADS